MKVKNFIYKVLLDIFFPKGVRVYERMLDDLFMKYEISSGFKSQNVSYNGNGYTVIPDSERNNFKFINEFYDNHIIDKSLFYLIPNVVVTHPLGVSFIKNNCILMNSAKNSSIYLNKSGFIKSYFSQIPTNLSIWGAAHIGMLTTALVFFVMAFSTSKGSR